MHRAGWSIMFAWQKGNVRWVEQLQFFGPSQSSFAFRRDPLFWVAFLYLSLVRVYFRCPWPIHQPRLFYSDVHSSLIFINCANIIIRFELISFEVNSEISLQMKVSTELIWSVHRVWMVDCWLNFPAAQCQFISAPSQQHTIELWRLWLSMQKCINARQ